jgi:hypothetical protein
MTALTLRDGSVSQPRLLDPPRVEHFCPAANCARSCGPEDCKCGPCRCADCRKRSRKPAAALTPDFPTRASQPRLFASPHPERSLIQ